MSKLVCTINPIELIVALGMHTMPFNFITRPKHSLKPVFRLVVVSNSSVLAD